MSGGIWTRQEMYLVMFQEESKCQTSEKAAGRIEIAYGSIVRRVLT